MAWSDLLSRKLDRRTMIISAFATAAVVGRVQAVTSRSRPSFAPIRATAADELVLPPSYRYDLVASWGDDIGRGTFGIENDFTAFFPIDLAEHRSDLSRPHHFFMPRAASSDDGLLVVNHESPLAVFGSGWDRVSRKTAAQIRKEQELVGMSVIRVRRENGQWRLVRDPRLNRRYDALSRMELTGPAASIDGGPVAVGTIANCSGGVTPWGTALSCEENFQDYPPSPPAGYGWGDDPWARRHYGWVVEVDPFEPDSTPRKHTALGRMRHENVAIRVASDGTVVAYMGDDKQDGCFYKFVADRRFSADRLANRSILESGRLYVADFGNGRWLVLDRDKDQRLAKHFPSQAEVLADARRAGLLVGGTPIDRPEDAEIHPHDGSVFIALTNNELHGNFHGHIVRIEETDSDPTAATFDWSIFAVGGPQSGFSSPDNLIFDDAGDLWMCTDVSDTKVGTGIYRFLGNNSLFRIATTGPDRGTAYRFASGPRACEMTGPAWTPDGSTLFLAIQHPGGDSRSLEALTSHWPGGGSSVPRGSVVAITGFAGSV